MEFTKGGHKVKLAACRDGKNQLLTYDKFQYRMKELQTYMIQVVPWHGESQCYTLKLDEGSSNSSKVQNLWYEYLELLTEPTRLPTCKPGVDHAINLQKGANPLNIRPYRYPAMNKKIIESLIEEMLTKGIIQHSSSPFASLMVLVKKKDGGWRMCVDCRVLNKLTIKK